MRPDVAADGAARADDVLELVVVVVELDALDELVGVVADELVVADALTVRPVPASTVTSEPDVTILAFWEMSTGPESCLATASASASVLGPV